MTPLYSSAFFLLVCLTVLSSSSLVVNENLDHFKNDNYCDFDGGNDEDKTSACSHLKNVFFICNKESPNSYTIPTSRVNDGICDCCDGSDEQNSPFKPNCFNSCEHELMQQKKQALAWHRTLQAGLQTKSDLVETLKRKKRAESKTYDQLKEEKKELLEMVKTMRFLHSRESLREKELRWQLIREREAHCASGSEAACNYFHSGFHADDEIVDQGYPLELLKLKKPIQHSYGQKELDFMSKLGVIERVRWSLCPVAEIMPDDDARIFGKLGEYLNFMNTPAAKTAQVNPISILEKKKRTLFGRYLEDGERGHVTAGVVLGETLGLLFSPVIVSANLISDGWDWVVQYVWLNIKTLANTADGNGDGTGISDSIVTIVTSSRKDNKNSDNKSSDKNKVCEVIDGVATCTSESDVASTEHNSNHDDSNSNNIGNTNNSKNSSNHNISSILLSQLSTLCHTIVTTIENDQSLYNKVLSFLDYTRYSAIMSTVDSLTEQLIGPLWVYEIALRAPYMYYNYYIAHKHIQLPPTRKCCILRNGMEQAKVALAEVQTKIDQEDEIRALLANDNAPNDTDATDFQQYVTYWKDLFYSFDAYLEDLFDNGGFTQLFSGKATISNKKTSKKSNKINAKTKKLKDKRAHVRESSQKSTKKAVKIDFGVDGVFETLKDICIEKEFTGYNYQLCFFGEITQNKHTSLGSFANWGTTETSVSSIGMFDSFLDGGENPVVAISNLASDMATSVMGMATTPRELTPLTPELVAEWVSDTANSVTNNVINAANVVSEAVSQQLIPQQMRYKNKNVLSGNGTQIRDAQEILYSNQYYNEGTNCQSKSGFLRRTVVELKCDVHNDIVDVIEIEMCSYKFIVSTPIVCTKYQEEKSFAELERLGVFGYTKKPKK